MYIINWFVAESRSISNNNYNNMAGFQKNVSIVRLVSEGFIYIYVKMYMLVCLKDTFDRFIVSVVLKMLR